MDSLNPFTQDILGYDHTTFAACTDSVLPITVGPDARATLSSHVFVREFAVASISIKMKRQSIRIHPLLFLEDDIA